MAFALRASPAESESARGERILVPLSVLVRHLDVPASVLKDLRPARPATAVHEALFELSDAKDYLRRRGVLCAPELAVLAG